MNLLQEPATPKFVPKGWGYELWIANSPLYCGKLLHFFADKKCSWHYHKLKDEVFYVHSGTLMVWYGNDQKKDARIVVLRAGESFHIEPGVRHQMKAVDGEVDLFEFSTEHFDEDSYRIEKGD